MRILDSNRGNYKHTYKDKDESCVFCGTEDILVCEGICGDHWRVLVNKFPYMDGNLMLVPKRHVESVGEIHREEWIEFGQILTKTQEILTKVFGVHSFNVGLNTGPESGASIPHIHWQIVPRKFKNVTVLNTFADLHIVSVTPEETKKMIDEATRE